jgi:hypothetical protein
MTKTTTVRLTDVKLSEAKQGKKGNYYIKTLVGGDKTFGGIQFDTDVAESVGDLVNIGYEETSYKKKDGTTGINNKIVTVEVLESGEVGQETDVEITTSLAPTPTSKSSMKRMTVQGTTCPGTPIPSKDISMEVSGIVQALLGTGKYNETNGDGNIYISEKLLTEHVKRALRIKRQIASELEQTGSV